MACVYTLINIEKEKKRFSGFFRGKNNSYFIKIKKDEMGKNLGVRKCLRDG